ncbi:hypothetical protein DEO72_LG10g2592 [Vigna unguiculata]|uniref:Uncharacterized protein n=1 Tax=Vigna unguiculata TaxID=3917 RepID=A0A4D6NFP2_VIGUN|nr:hypothetical protein DEO72_LG10g2592 [Vigna unguiculata]
MVADPVTVAGTTVTSCRVCAHLSFVRKRMGGEWSLVWTPATVGIANGGLQQAGPRSHEGDQCNPYLERVREAKEETPVEERFARGRIKGDSVAGENSGEGHWWW